MGRGASAHATGGGALMQAGTGGELSWDGGGERSWGGGALMHAGTGGELSWDGGGQALMRARA